MKRIVKSACISCGEEDGDSDGYADGCGYCNVCWAILNPSFEVVLIRFKSSEAMPKSFSEDFTLIKSRNSVIYEGIHAFKTCDSYEARSSCVGCLGGLSDGELVRVFDYAWSAGRPI